MKKMLILISLSAALIASALTTANPDDAIQPPSILGGKIWGGSDTIDVGKKIASDSVISLEGDTAVAAIPPKEIDWSSDDVIELAEKWISSKTELLALRLSVTRSLKFIPDAPLILVAHSGDPSIISIGDCISTNPEKPLLFPVTITVDTGRADIFIYYKVVACTTGPKGACFFKEAKLKIPVIIGDYENNILAVRREIEN